MSPPGHLEVVEEKREIERQAGRQKVTPGGWPWKGSHTSCCVDLRSRGTPTSREERDNANAQSEVETSDEEEA